jgi:hypothetical protein
MTPLPTSPRWGEEVNGYVQRNQYHYYIFFHVAAE